MKNMKSIKLLLPSQFKTGFYLLFLYTRQSMRLLTAGSLVRVQLGEPCRSKVRFAPAYFLPLAENKPSARSCLPSCGTRLWLQRINRLANRRPLCQQILAVSRAAGALICCPFPQKVTLHLRCSLVNALATLRFAIVHIQILRWHLFR